MGTIVTPINTNTVIRSEFELERYNTIQAADGTLQESGDPLWTMYLPVLQNKTSTGKNNIIQDPLPQEEAENAITLNFLGTTTKFDLTFNISNLAEISESRWPPDRVEYADLVSVGSNTANIDRYVTYVEGYDTPVRTIIEMERFAMKQIVTPELDALFHIKQYHRKWRSNISSNAISQFSTSPYEEFGLIDNVVMRYSGNRPDIGMLSFTFLVGKNVLVQDFDFDSPPRE